MLMGLEAEIEIYQIIISFSLSNRVDHKDNLNIIW